MITIGSDIDINMGHSDYQSIISQVMKFSNLGLERSEVTGAILIGRAPHVAPRAVINSMYQPISDDDVKFIESEIGLEMPSDYKYFLTHISNGLKLFVGTFSLYGLRRFMGRSPELIRQPYNIIQYNTSELPENTTDSMYIIGSYKYDGSRIYMTPDNMVHYCKRNDATSLLTWPSLKEMLESEITRLYQLFDDKGIRHSKSTSANSIMWDQETLPIII